MSNSYAIVRAGGRQFRVEKGTRIVVDRMSAEQGDKVQLAPVAYLGDGDSVLGGDGLEKVKVEAVVEEHLRGPKLRVFKYKPKKGYRRSAGHRSELTRLEVTEVKLLQRKPAQKKAQEKAAPATKKAAAPATKKPSAAKSKSGGSKAGGAGKRAARSGSARSSSSKRTTKKESS